MGLKAKLLVPLYNYPVTEETWKPLYDAIAAHPDTEFVIVVNPGSGPYNGNNKEPLPGSDYVREIPKLNAFSNVITVGYVRVGWCKRPLDDVFDEIDTYAGWSQDNPHMGMNGILLDETPNHYTKARSEYLDVVNRHIKTVEGLSEPRLLLHNPGTPPDAGLGDGPDVIITSEEPYEKFTGEDVQKRLRDYHYEQSQSGFMISAVPDGEIGPLMQELRQRGAYLFVSGLKDDFYESFGKGWDEFVASLDS